MTKRGCCVISWALPSTLLQFMGILVLRPCQLICIHSLVNSASSRCHNSVSIEYLIQRMLWYLLDLIHHLVLRARSTPTTLFQMQTRQHFHHIVAFRKVLVPYRQVFQQTALTLYQYQPTKQTWLLIHQLTLNRANPKSQTLTCMFWSRRTF